MNVNGQWMQVTGEEYGDYMYFIDSVWTLPHTIAVNKNEPEEVVLAYYYDHKNYRSG